jgi:hypothetical protein
MARLINLGTASGDSITEGSIHVNENALYPEDFKCNSEPELSFDNYGTTEVEIADNLQLLKEMYPQKILFSLQEVSQILNISYEYVRTKTVSGIIKCIKYGDRKMVHLTELAALISKGV